MAAYRKFPKRVLQERNELLGHYYYKELPIVRAGHLKRTKTNNIFARRVD